MDFIPGVDGQGIPPCACRVHARPARGTGSCAGRWWPPAAVLPLRRRIRERAPAHHRQARSLPGQIINLGNDKNDVSIRTLARKPGMRISRAKTERPRAPFAHADRWLRSTARATTIPSCASPPWPRLSACSGGARTCLSLRCCHPSWPTIWRAMNRGSRAIPAPASSHRACHEAGRPCPAYNAARHLPEVIARIAAARPPIFFASLSSTTQHRRHRRRRAGPGPCRGDIRGRGSTAQRRLRRCMKSGLQVARTLDAERAASVTR